MNNIDLQGRIAVVTGGAQGIGYAVARRLAVSGARLALWDVNEERVGSAAQTFDTEAIACACDVTDAAAIAGARDATEAALGPVDILVHSAGIAGPNAPTDVFPDEAWRTVIDVNLTGTYLVNKALIPAMKQRNYGRIVNIASIAGKEGNPTAGAYSASKAGVIALTKTLGKELAEFNISVNCVTPAAAKTPIFEQVSDEHIAYMLSKIPRGRFLEVDEAAAMIAWLVSEENSFTTGAAFDLSGGRATY